MNPMLAAIMRQLEGEKIGSYCLEKLVGVGGFGVVYVVSEVVKDEVIEQLAVKIIPDSTSEQLKELKEARKLNHPHLIQSLNSGECTFFKVEMLYLAMELAQESLQSRLEKGQISSTEVKNITQQIATGLVFLHSQNKVHRDLKPGNVLLVNNQWKLSDFGLMRKLDNESIYQTANPLGTIAYMPPEAFDGVISCAWDLWSLGIMLISMTTGNLPYEFNDLTELQKKVINFDLKIPPLPKEFEQIILGCLQKDRKKRWTAEQVLDALVGQASSLSPPTNTSNIKILIPPKMSVLPKLITKRANFTQLNEYLKQGKWEEADQETTDIMFNIIKLQSNSNDDDKWKNFPREELKIIDDLWVKYSNRHFGFSIQKEIWDSLIGKGDDFSLTSRYWRFADQVGWRVEKNWLNLKNISFHLQSRKGHLPFFKGCALGWDRYIMGGKIYLFSLL
jgi:serine/threonine protein kinase